MLHRVRRAERMLMSYERTGKMGGEEGAWLRGSRHPPLTPSREAGVPPHPAGPTLVPPLPAGWLEDQPAVITDRMEIRPAAELGPIILCLDTSGSMSVSGCKSVNMCGVLSWVPSSCASTPVGP